MERLLFGAICLTLAGCAAPATQMVECPSRGCAALDPPEADPYHAALREHAEFDLQCPRASLDVADLDDTTAQVSGCGRSARYAYIVTRYQSRWLLDSPIVAARGA